MPGASRRTISTRSSALRCPSWRRKISRIRSRLLERFPPAGRIVERSGSCRFMWRATVWRLGEWTSPTHQLANSARPMSLDVERLTAAARRRGVRILDREPAALHRVDEVDLGAVQIPDADRIHEELDAVRFEDLVAGPLAVFLDHQPILKARTAAALHEHSQTAAG